MAHKLPDETLAMILGDSLLVPDSSFASVESQSPFSRTPMSSSAYLLVCKRWLRVATPLLYETVVLRSVAQARALAAALDSNPEFARFVLKLRVEGGYGAAVASVLKAAKGIKHLCVSLNLGSTDNAKPMYDVLRDTVKPTRLIIAADRDMMARSNKQQSHAISTLILCIETWPSLRVLVTQECILLHHDDIFDAACNTSQLSMIALPNPEPQFHWIMFLNKLALCKAPTIQVGWTKYQPCPYNRWPFDLLIPAALRKVRFVRTVHDELEERRRILARHANVFFRPLENVPDNVRRHIWTLVLSEVIEEYDAVDYRWRQDMLRPRSVNYDPSFFDPLIVLMRVCKEWKNIAQGIGCRNLVFTGFECMNAWREFVSQRVDAPGLTRSLLLFPKSSLFNDGSWPLYDATIRTIIVALPNLRELDVRYLPLSPETISMLPGSLQVLKVGATKRDCAYTLPRLDFLHTLRWISIGSGGFSRAKDPAVLPLLRTLEIEVARDIVVISLLEQYSMPQLSRLTIINLAGKFASIDPIVPGCLAGKTFPVLQVLEVRDSGAIINALSEISMPRLAEFSFNSCKPGHLGNFLQKNGAAIEVIQQGFNDQPKPDRHLLDVAIDHCPLLSFIDASRCRMPMAPLARREKVHKCLQEIVCPNIPNLTPSSTADTKRRVAGWARFANSVSGPSFPKMRKFRIASDALWPDTSKNTIRHPLPPVVEAFLERGIHVVDALNVGWRPRMTARKAS